MSAIDNIELMIGALPLMLKATVNTLYLSAGSMVGVLLVGMIIAIFRISGFKTLGIIARLYVAFFRGTPLLIQLFILYFGLTYFNIVLGPWTAVYLGLSLHFGAYVSEAFRGAIISIDKGQWEASMSLGMTKVQAFRKNIFPQAWRRSLPPVFNHLIDTVKDTSLASTLTLTELTYEANVIGSSQGFIFFPMLMLAALIYWALTTILNITQDSLEKRIEY
jgi:cystine transport system permease protein